MSRQKNDQVHFGELLTKARLEKKLSRAQLSKETGISENSLIRYEKAGLEKDGQFPPAPKLATLCFHLGIAPAKALWGCLTFNEYWDYKSTTWEDDLMEHPDYEFLTDEYFSLMKENRLMRTALNVLCKEEEPTNEYNQEQRKLLKTKFFEIENKWKEIEKISGRPQDKMMCSTPGIPEEKRDEYWGPRIEKENDSK